MNKKIGFGGGCHWCTEAYFLSLKGVEKVEPGWISSQAPDDSFSEAVIVHYDPDIIPLTILIAIHLHTHSSTKNHSFRNKYRSAIYVFDGKMIEVEKLIVESQIDFEEKIITQVLLFGQFKKNNEQYSNYYEKHKEGPFCQRYISPKLEMIEKNYGTYFEHL